MNTRPSNDPFGRLNDLSDTLYGDASEMSSEEAREWLDRADLDPRILKANLLSRAEALKEQCQRDRQNPPQLIDKLIAELGSRTTSEPGGIGAREKLWISKLLNDIRQLPQVMHAGFEPSFSNAYRNKKELTTADKAVLDRIAEETKQRLKESR